ADERVEGPVHEPVDRLLDDVEQGLSHRRTRRGRIRRPKPRAATAGGASASALLLLQFRWLPEDGPLPALRLHQDDRLVDVSRLMAAKLVGMINPSTAWPQPTSVSVLAALVIPTISFAFTR